MKKFTAHLLIFTLVIFTSYVVFKKNNILMFKGVEYQSWQYKFDIIDNADLNDKILVFGDSATEAAFNPVVIDPENIYNLAIPGGTPFDMYTQIKRIINRKQKPRKIFIIYSFVNYLMDDGFLLQNINYNFYSPEEIKEALLYQLKNGFLFSPHTPFKNLAHYFPYNLFFGDQSLEGHYRLSFLEYYLSKYHLSLIDINRFRKFIIKENYEEQSFIEYMFKELKENHGYYEYIDRDVKELIYSENHFNNSTFAIHSFPDHYLRKALKLIKESNIEVVIEFIPLPMAYRSIMTSGFIEDAQSYFNKISSEYNIPVNSNFQALDKSHYADQIHSNKKGTSFFTDYMKRTYFTQ